MRPVAQPISEPPETTEGGIDKERLDALGMSLARSRSEAIEYREQCGIEDEWREDEEFYEGLDDANRYEHKAWRTKPLGQAALPSQGTPTSSNLFLNITQPYCDAAAARVGDMLLPTDDRAWEINPTPVPDMVALSKGDIPLDMQDEIAVEHTDPEMQQQVSTELVNTAKRQVDKAKEHAAKASKRIDDWHTQCQYHAEMRRVIEDCSKVGTGVMKGPVITKRRHIAYKNGSLIVADKIEPESHRVDYWNIYPDPGCGENIHNGGFVWERDEITHKKLHGLKGTKGYIDAQIDAALKDGPCRATKVIPEHPGDVQPSLRHGDKLYEIWYFHGMLERDDLIAAGYTNCPEGILIPAEVKMVGNRVIGADINLIDTGEFPYDIMVWQQRKAMPYGRGVARQIRGPQRMLNGAARNMMDNAGRAGGPQVIIKQGVVVPENGVWELKPWKAWLASEDADLDHLDNAFRFVAPPIMQVELQAIIMLALRMAEDTTGMPVILQGQMGENEPETLGQTQILQNNASGVMRRIARLYDDRITEPHIRRYYRYVLLYGKDDEKGDFQVDARGSSALVDRDVKGNALLQMGVIFTNPIFGKDPRKWADEILKSQRFDPDNFNYDDEEWKKIIENMSQQPQDNTLAVAQLKAQVDQWKAQLDNQLKQTQMALESEEKGLDRELDLLMKSIDAEIEQAKLLGNQSINLDQLKAKLADTAMKLKTQTRLAGLTQVMKPAAEPPGRAPEGRAFSR